jgi:hypothetical protein
MRELKRCLFYEKGAVRTCRLVLYLLGKRDNVSALFELRKDISSHPLTLFLYLCNILLHANHSFHHPLSELLRMAGEGQDPGHPQSH